MSEKLTKAHIEILGVLAEDTTPPAPSAYIAECCGHFYKPGWASTKLNKLLDRGLVAKPSRGMWSITPAGRSAIGEA